MPSYAKATTCAPAMIDWLCRAFGFERQAVYEDGQGGIAHAQLSFGHGMIMLSTHRESGWGEFMALPEQVGGRETQSCCLIVDDPDAHHAQAVAAGAVVIDPLSDRDYGGRGYGCKDPEGHLWWIGSYDPWQ
jgi:uncharacterized glyoxalase superfamily protein PhnB